MKHFTKKLNGGFVILFTILTCAVILLIGFGIVSVATRETVLSSTAREAQSAFYAADAGIECALYAQTNGDFDKLGKDVNCGQTSFKIKNIPFNFDIMLEIPESNQITCARISVFNEGTARRVIAQGYNLCNDDGEALMLPNLVERVLDIRYELPVIVGANATPLLPASTNPLTP